MKKLDYSTPRTEITELGSAAIICASQSGSNEDFGRGSSYDF